MGLFGKSDAEKEREEQAKHEEARRKMQESQRRRDEKAKAAAAAKPAAPAPATPGAAAARPGASAGPAGDKPVPVPGMTPTAAQPSAAAPQIYTVQKGDSLSKIAKKQLGDANAWRKIYEANRAVIGDNPDKIFPGQKLTLPGGASPGQTAGRPA